MKMMRSFSVVSAGEAGPPVPAAAPPLKASKTPVDSPFSRDYEAERREPERREPALTSWIPEPDALEEYAYDPGDAEASPSPEATPPLDVDSLQMRIDGAALELLTLRGVLAAPIAELDDELEESAAGPEIVEIDIDDDSTKEPSIVVPCTSGGTEIVGSLDRQDNDDVDDTAAFAAPMDVAEQPSPPTTYRTATDELTSEHGKADIVPAEPPRTTTSGQTYVGRIVVRRLCGKPSHGRVVSVRPHAKHGAMLFVRHADGSGEELTVEMLVRCEDGT